MTTGLPGSTGVPSGGRGGGSGGGVVWVASYSVLTAIARLMASAAPSFSMKTLRGPTGSSAPPTYSSGFLGHSVICAIDRPAGHVPGRSLLPDSALADCQAADPSDRLDPSWPVRPDRKSAPVRLRWHASIRRVWLRRVLLRHALGWGLEALLRRLSWSTSWTSSSSFGGQRPAFWPVPGACAWPSS